MPCNCGSNRIARVNAKCSDMCVLEYSGQEKVGYVPDGVGIGGGDYVEFSYCLDCGKIQGEFPISEEEIREAIDWEEE